MLAVKGAHIAALTVQLKEKDMMLHVSGKVCVLSLTEER